MSIEMTAGIHKCPHCGRRQHALVIGLDRDGRVLRCKQCGERFRPLTPAEATRRERERKRKWAEEHRDYMKEYKRRYRAEHLEEMREKERRYRARNRERINALNRAWRNAHIEQERERNRLYYREHRESIKLAKAYKKLYGARGEDAWHAPNHSARTAGASYRQGGAACASRDPNGSPRPTTRPGCNGSRGAGTTTTPTTSRRGRKP